MDGWESSEDVQSTILSLVASLNLQDSDRSTGDV
jgi:hypothetical protein